MTMYARIVDGVAVDVSSDLAGHYHPQVAAQFVAVPGDVRRGWRLAGGGAWSAPAPSAPPAPEQQKYRAEISPVEFKMLFTPAERLSIRQAREYAGDDSDKTALAYMIDDWWQIVDDPRLSTVNLALTQTQEGLDMLVTAGILTQARRDEIGKGLPV